ncbi:MULTISPECIES: hypothetical protein [Salinivibrio]|uniref:hypothetical protein n=1 Tax=Salinivibrio TaxID=51366 RepID=UPI0009861D7B|nr:MULTISPECIES: hypothetical protein [Salinivibrio]OOE43334.1 hypothetical protein BZG10_15180 [Salinivibrio kushneri]OOE47460.1 hypothetical protein BZG11_15515 [Salinivibrio kushneri]OOE60701.1 hypothetical protein BZG18_10955 [Salinivibrio kushneri]OOF08869.1 hypothetical protein BZG83_15630 [Salinivibrio sp. PR919]OOF09614.1 hypothetical protein BZG82_10165 [Salinivibrio sp. PR5]
MFKKNHVHLQIKKGEVKATHLETDSSIVRTCAALSHPRTLMGEFFAIERCLKEVLDELLPKSIFSLSPIAIVQFIEKIEGGITNVEVRAFREATLGAGARHVFFAESSTPISKSQLLNFNFKQIEQP